MDVLIIEDEARSANRLEKLLKTLRSDIQVLDILDSVQSSIEWINSHPEPELIFMDIHLADGSSFEILNKVELKAPIIFITAYDQYAIEAFKTNSIDYLLKPIKEEDLKEAFDKLENIKEVFGGSGLDKDELARMIRGEISPYQQRFLIRLTDQFKVFDVNDVAYFYIQSRITFMKLKSGKSYPIDFSLDQLEERLHPARFFRLNRQFSISFDSIAKMYPYPKSKIKLELSPEIEQEVMVSSEKSAAFKKWMMGVEKK